MLGLLFAQICVVFTVNGIKNKVFNVTLSVYIVNDLFSFSFWCFASKWLEGGPTCSSFLLTSEPCSTSSDRSWGLLSPSTWEFRSLQGCWTCAPVLLWVDEGSLDYYRTLLGPDDCPWCQVDGSLTDIFHYKMIYSGCVSTTKVTQFNINVLILQQKPYSRIRKLLWQLQQPPLGSNDAMETLWSLIFWGFCWYSWTAELEKKHMCMNFLNSTLWSPLIGASRYWRENGNKWRTKGPPRHRRCSSNQFGCNYHRRHLSEIRILSEPFDNRVYQEKWLVRSLPRQGYTRIFEDTLPQKQ